MAGQTMTDRLLAARHSIAGQGLAKSVCKATTEELIGPKKKHLDYLIHCTNEPNVSIPQLANLLIERSQNTNWVVVFKALITVHHLMCYGNERFTQYLASSNSTFQLSNFLDKSGMQGYDMSPFIRRYAKYLNEKAMSYRTVAFDFCKVKRGKEDGVLRTMNSEKLLKTLPVLQSQLDELLEFDCTPADLTNGVINMAFMLLFRDLIRLFAGYNDSIINLLEKYFEMNKKQCRQALDLYKKFLIRMDRVGEFLKVAENVGIDKGEIPDLTKAPSSLLDALEQHLAALEGKKGSAANTPTQTASQRTDVKSGVSALCSTSSAFGSAAHNSDVGGEETLRQQALAEEEAAINHYKSKVQSPTSNATPAAATNPFLISSPTQPIVDLFGSPPAPNESQVQQTGKASDDLLQLGNPFADVFSTPVAPTVTAAPLAPAQPANNMWISNGFGTVPQQVTTNNAFVSDSAFNSVFGSDTTGTAAPAGTMDPAANPFMSDFPSGGVETVTGGSSVIVGGLSGSGKVCTPPPPRPPPPRATSPPKSALDELNDTIRMALGGGSSPSRPPPPPNTQPSLPSQFALSQQTPPIPQQAAQQLQQYSSPAKVPMAAMTATGGETVPGKVLTGDLDSSLAKLAENLNINKGNQQPVKGMQWSSPKNSAKGTGPGGWSPQPMAATTGANYRPMGHGMIGTPAFNSISHMGMRVGGQVPPAGGVGSPRQGPPQQQLQEHHQLDPFGAL